MDLQQRQVVHGTITGGNWYTAGHSVLELCPIHDSDSEDLTLLANFIGLWVNQVPKKAIFSTRVLK